MRGCVNEDEALAYLRGAVSTDTRRLIDEHVRACSICLELMLVLDSDRTHGVGRAMSPSGPLPEPFEELPNYRVLEEIGSGSMGIIYAAYDLELERRVALRVVRQNLAASSDRIRRQAQAMARLSHPNVVTIYGVHTLSNNGIVIAMEYVSGKSLKEWIRSPPRMSWASIRQIFVQAAAGLAAAHEAGLVHRDFKPDNLLVTDDGHSKVIDFGLADIVQPSSEAHSPCPELGDFREGVAMSERVLEAAEATGYLPVAAEALFLRGRYLFQAQKYSESVAALERAYRVAVEANHLDLAADASRELVWIVGYFLAKPELGAQWSVTSVSMARLRDVNGLREAESLARLGKLEAFMGKSRDAQTHLQAAEALFRRHTDSTHPALGETVMDLGTSFFGEGRYQEALKHYRRALEIKRSTYGPRHFRLSRAHQNVGIALINLQRWAEAEESLEQAQRLIGQSGRGTTVEAGMLFHNRAQLAKRRGRTALAAERYAGASRYCSRPSAPTIPEPRRRCGV